MIDGRDDALHQLHSPVPDRVLELLVQLELELVLVDHVSVQVVGTDRMDLDDLVPVLDDQRVLFGLPLRLQPGGSDCALAERVAPAVEVEEVWVFQGFVQGCRKGLGP